MKLTCWPLVSSPMLKRLQFILRWSSVPCNVTWK
jgi:hypothetical protein